MKTGVHMIATGALIMAMLVVYCEAGKVCNMLLLHGREVHEDIDVKGDKIGLNKSQCSSCDQCKSYS